MRINYVTLCDERMPAYRYRMRMPGEYIGDYAITRMPVEADIHVYSKPYHDNAGLLAATLEIASRQPFVFDICDDLFSRPPDVVSYIRQMMDMAAVVTTSTHAMQDLIREETGIEAVVISDPCEFGQRPIKDISEPRVMWFGTATNIGLLKGTYINYPFEIVCQLNELTEPFLKKIPFDFTFTEWSLESMQAAFDRNNVVFIPTSPLRKKQVKSPNRVAESIRQGLSVVAGQLPAYQQFDRWITDSLDDIRQITPEAQQYVNDNFDISVIGEQWKQLFRQVLSDSTSAVATSTSMAG